MLTSKEAVHRADKDLLTCTYWSSWKVPKSPNSTSRVQHMMEVLCQEEMTGRESGKQQTAEVNLALESPP